MSKDKKKKKGKEEEEGEGTLLFINNFDKRFKGRGEKWQENKA